MDEKEREARIVEARMKLRGRHLAKDRAPDAPLGSGPSNRHGMPRLPVGQYATEKWPVLDLGRHPKVPLEKWALRIDGAVEEPVTLDWRTFTALPQIEDTSDFHCVTTWSKFDLRWKGVQLATALALARPLPAATHLMLHAYDGYTTNIPLAEAVKDDVLLAWEVEGRPLPVEHGGPVRAVTPQLYAWKGAKWVNRLEVLLRDRRGYWEERGYSNTADPWRDDRYS